MRQCNYRVSERAGEMFAREDAPWYFYEPLKLRRLLILRTRADQACCKGVKMLRWKIFEGSQTDGTGAAALIIFPTWMQAWTRTCDGRWDMGVPKGGGAL